MKMTNVASCGALALLLVTACVGTPASEQERVQASTQAVQKSDPRKIYAHLMPWFETPGFHWDMVGRHYNPQIGPYHSGDYKVIEYQLLLMKYAGIDGVIIDWPGRSSMYPDLPANAENTDQIVEQTAKFGLEFAMCFEDQYAGDVNDAINSMQWAKDHYFNRPNHIKVGGQPALFVFGPQRIGAGDWPAVLGATGTDPKLYTLWYNDKAGGTRDGTFAWIYSDGLDGVRNYYGRDDQGDKVPVVYPGFHAAYPDGAPGWGVGYDANGDTFKALWDMSKGIGQMVQIATWNDYTEGTMIEPTNEFGYRFLTTLQQALGVPYGQKELEIVRQLFDRRKANDPKADAASQALINFDVQGACAQLGCDAPTNPGGTAGTSSGTAGSAPGRAGSPSMAGSPGTGTAGSPARGGSSSVGGSAPGDGGESDEGDDGDSGGCSVHPGGTPRIASWLAAVALALAARRRRH
jgi:MYXO-CTERM domain-containing protein